MSHRLSGSGRNPFPSPYAQPLLTQSSPVQPSPVQDVTTTTTSTAAPTATTTATATSTVTSTSTALGPGSMHPSVPMKSDVERFKEAARAHDRQATQDLLDQGADINAHDEKDRTSALHALAQAGDVQAVQLLCELGADREIRDHKGRTPLMLAARHDRHETVAALLARGAQVDSSDLEGRIALQYAARSNCLTSVQQLCAAGSKVDTQGRHGWKRSALHLAAAHGNLAMVRVLVEAGASVELKCSGEATPFLYAAGSGNVELLQYLKEIGCNIKHGSKVTPGGANVHRNQNAMTCAAQGGRVQAIRLLHDWGLDVNGGEELEGWDGPMHYALIADQAEAAKALAELGAKRPDRNSVLQQCVQFGNVKATEVLLDWGDDPNHVTQERAGGRPVPVLWWAVHSGGADMFRLLVKRGAKLDHAQMPGSLLVEAARCNQSATVECLLDEQQMDINLFDKETRKTPLIAAAELGQLETVKLLLKRGAKPNFCPGEDSKTAATLAALAGHVGVVRALSEYGLRPHVSEFKAAMEHAITNGLTDMVQVLIEFGYAPTEHDLKEAQHARPYIPAVIDLLLEQVHPGRPFAAAADPALLFKGFLELKADDTDSDDDIDFVDDSDSNDGEGSRTTLTELGVRSSLWPLMDKALKYASKVMPFVSAEKKNSGPTQRLAWYCSLLPNLTEPDYEAVYQGHPALVNAARAQYADIMAAADKVTAKLVIDGMHSLHVRCISALVLDPHPQPVKAIALMLHKETGLLMPLANLLADCWKCAIGKAGDLEMKGKLKDLAKNLEQQLMPYLVRELKSLMGRPGFDAVPSGDLPEAYYLILNRQLELTAAYRKGLEQRIPNQIELDPERIADYA